MKILVIMLITMSMTSGCSLFQSNNFKEKAINAVVKVVKPMSVKVLGCRTGDPVGNDLSLRLERLLKVKESNDMEKGLVGDICTYAVRLALPYLVNLSNKKLPESWIADGCSLENVGGSIDSLAGKLCAKIPF